MNSTTNPPHLGGFPKIFWIAGGVDLLERVAYYGVFIVIALYLSRILGFNDVQATWLSGSFSAGLYFLPTFLGFSHLHSFSASILGFGLSGYLLTAYCPDPRLFETRELWEATSANAHYIWYYFAAIGAVSAVSLIIYGKVIARMDAKS